MSRNSYSIAGIFGENIDAFSKPEIIGLDQSLLKHLQTYVDEFVFRYNTKDNSEVDRFNTLLSNTEYRLTYKELINA